MNTAKNARMLKIAQGAIERHIWVVRAAQNQFSIFPFTMTPADFMTALLPMLSMLWINVTWLVASMGIVKLGFSRLG